MTEILNLHKHINNTDYLYLNIIITELYLYVIYYDIDGNIIINTYKYKNRIKLYTSEAIQFKIGSVVRNEKTYMCLTSGTVAILKEDANYNNHDIVLSNNDYRTFMALCFKYKSLYDTNKFYTHTIC